MALVATQTGLFFPEIGYRFNSLSNATNLNAATNKSAMIGHVYWSDRGTHTISSAGGQIKWLPGSSITFVNGSTTIDVGIQDVDTSNGPPARPDGTFDVKATLTGGVATITDTTLNTVSMTTGSKSIAHGDLMAVVLDMTARGGADIVRTSSVGTQSSLGGRPTMTQFTSGAWGSQGGTPNVMLVADDGTLGIFDGAVPYQANISESFSTSTNPNERGLIFQVPWDIKYDGYLCSLSGGGAAADGAIGVYADPTGTPTLVSGSQLSFLGENFERNNSNQWFQFLLPAEVSLSKNTDYCLAVRVTGATAASITGFTVPDTNARKFVPGGTTLKKATRNTSGAFTAESPAITLYQLAVRISSLTDTGGGGQSRARAYAGL